MHSSYSLYACLFLLNFCGFFSALEAGSDIWVPPSSLITEKLRTAIDVTSKWSHGKPLTFYTPLAETCLVNRTHQSIKVTLVDKITVSTVTGGVLGNKVYEFYTYWFSWKPCGCSGNYDFKANAIYFDTGYGSYDKALEHPNGIAVISLPITTSGNYSNPKFYHYGKFFKCQIKKHLSVGKIKSAFTYTWFLNFNQGGIYHACSQKFRDSDTGKQTTAIVITLPSNPSSNFISSDQFRIFLEMGDSMGQEVNSCSSDFETYKGIVVCNLFA